MRSKTSGNSGVVAFKIDIRKAFDSIEWDSILKVLSSFGFSSTFCNWDSSILHSARLSIVLNGAPKGYFSCSCGVCQGDPLSPLLFCIAEEYLSRKVTSLANLGHYLL